MKAAPAQADGVPVWCTDSEEWKRSAIAAMLPSWWAEMQAQCEAVAESPAPTQDVIEDALNYGAKLQPFNDYVSPYAADKRLKVGDFFSVRWSVTVDGIPATALQIEAGQYECSQEWVTSAGRTFDNRSFANTSTSSRAPYVTCGYEAIEAGSEHPTLLIGNQKMRAPQLVIEAVQSGSSSDGNGSSTLTGVKATCKALDTEWYKPRGQRRELGVILIDKRANGCYPYLSLIHI